eukprot:757371-Hanusia_phi.AAC.7
MEMITTTMTRMEMMDHDEINDEGDEADDGDDDDDDDDDDDGKYHVDHEDDVVVDDDDDGNKYCDDNEEVHTCRYTDQTIFPSISMQEAVTLAMLVSLRQERPTASTGEKTSLGDKGRLDSNWICIADASCFSTSGRS